MRLDTAQMASNTGLLANESEVSRLPYKSKNRPSTLDRVLRVARGGPAILFMLSILVAAIGPELRAQISGEETIVRVFFDDLPTGRLIAAGLEPIESKYENGYLVVEVTAEQLQRLQQRGLRTEPVSAQELTTILAPPRVIRSDQAPGQAAVRATTGIPGFSCYRTVEETFAAADSIVANNPTLASWVDVGDSWLKTDAQGGYDMQVLVLTNQNVSGTKPKMFVTSAIHAREYTPAELMTRFAEDLIRNYGVTADATWLLDYHEVHLMLQANPDGRKHAEAGQLWRKNVNENYCEADPDNRGADLNRNFDFAWNCCGGSSDLQCSDTYHGASAASEPEALSIQNYIRSIFPDQRGPDFTDSAPDDATGIYLDIHSTGQLILYPYGFTERLAPNNSQLRTFARKLAFFNRHTPQHALDLYKADGTTDEFGYGEMGLASFTYELGTAFFEDCSYFEDTLLPRNMPSLYYAAKVARTPYMTPSGPDVVDGSLSLSAGEWPSVVMAGTSITLSAILSDSQFNNSNGTEPTQSLEAAEYYIDAPLWVTTPVPVPLPMEARDGDVYEAPIDTADLSAGRHIVFVRGKDSDQNWGAFSAIFLGIGMPTDPPPPPPPPPPVPDAPRNLLADGNDGQVTLSWEVPEDDGGSAITDYEYRIDQTGEWISIGSTATTHTVTGLVNGTAYVFQVRAVTAAGSSAPSNRVEATPRAAVTLLVANFSNGNNGAFNSRVYLWNPSASAGQVTVRVFTLPLTTGIARELTGLPLDLGTLEARSALNLKLVEDILIPLEIALPYTTDGGNLMLEFTIQAVDVRGAAQVFSSDFAFGTYPMQEIPSTSSGSPTVLVANFTNGNNGALHSRVYLWNPSATDGHVTVRVFTLPNTGDSMRLQTVPLGILKAFSARNIRIAEDILGGFLGIALPYTDDGGNLMLEFTIEAPDVKGAAQVFSSDFAFGTYPLQEIPSTSSGSPTVLVANFTNGNNGALHSRVYLWNPSASAGEVTVRVFTLPQTGNSSLLGTLDLGSLQAESARNLKLAEDILAPLGIALPYVTDGGNLTLEFTIQAANARGVAQVFSSDFAFGTYPMQEIPSTSSGSPTVLVANFMNGNDAALNSRVYLWNPSLSAGSVTVRVFTLPLTAGVAQELTSTPLDLGTLGAESARNLKLVEDILIPLGIPTPYVTDGGNLTLEFTIQAADVRGAAQVFSSSFAFGTVPLQVIR